MILEITGIGTEMQGVGRAEDGQVVFVPMAIPGEQVEVDSVRRVGGVLYGEVKQILRASPERTQPLCPLYGRCGGCKTQHMSYKLSLELKRRIVAEQLERIGRQKDVCVYPTKASPKPWKYRNKGEFAVTTGEGGMPNVGVFAGKSHTVLPMQNCLLHDDMSTRALRVVIKWMQIYCIPAYDDPEAGGGIRYVITRVSRAGNLMLILSTTTRQIRELDSLRQMLFKEFSEKIYSLYQIVLREHHVDAFDGYSTLLAGGRVLLDRLAGLSFAISPRTFFQVNLVQTDALYECVREAAALTGRELVLDAYCGCGTISLALARDAERVVGVELNAGAVNDAVENANRNKLWKKAEFYAGDAGVKVAELVDKGMRPDVLVVDPPRKGIDARLLSAIMKAEIPRVVYVSCNPGTMARDIRSLTENGEYRLEYVQPVDMFSQTEHVECVARLTRVEKRGVGGSDEESAADAY